MFSSRVAATTLTWLLPGLALWLATGIGQVGTQSTEIPINCTVTLHQSNGSLCLWLVKDVKTWQDADDDCAMHGGYLVAVTSPEIHDVVYSIMKNHSLSSVWLGVTEKVDTWRWLKGNAEVYNQGCYKEDPNDREFVNRFTIGNNSYTLCTEKCASEGKKYAALQTESECWCGDTFGKYGHGDCNLLCNNRSQVCGGNVKGEIANFVFRPGGAYSDWERGQPNNHQFYQACAVMDDYNDYQWNDLQCTEASGVICELDLDRSTCLNGNFRYHDKWGCYDVSNFTMTFFKGLYYCDQRQGRLLTLENQEKRDYYVNMLIQNKNTTVPDAFFIGLTRTQWVWSTGEPMIFSFWGQGWPNGKDQQCAIVDSQGKWNDVTCSAPYNYICQRGSSPRPPTTLPTTTTTPTTTTPTTTTTRKPCDASCKRERENAVREYQQKKKDERQLIYYCLIGGGAGLFVILVICSIGTVYCIKSHARKKKENRFDYFFGVDVSRPEDDKGFTPKEKKTSKKVEKGSKPNDTLDAPSDGAVVISEVTAPGEKTRLNEEQGPLADNGGIENNGFVPADGEIATSTPRTDSLETKSRRSKDVPDIVMTSVVTSGSRPTSQAVDVTSDASNDHVTSDTSSENVEQPGEVQENVLADSNAGGLYENVSNSKGPDGVVRPGSEYSDPSDKPVVLAVEEPNNGAAFGTDMMNYDFDNPESSQMIY